jgi:phage terminase large subunit-like protein
MKDNTYRNRLAKLIMQVPHGTGKDSKRRDLPRHILWNDRSKKVKFLCELGKKNQSEQEKFLKTLTVKQRNIIYNSWEWTSRSEQIPSPDKEWNIWLLIAGRGCGKSRAAKEWLVKEMIEYPGQYAFFCRNASDLKKDIFEGSDSIEYIIGSDNIKSRDVRGSTMQLKNGSFLYGFSGEVENSARGKNLSGVVFDEWAFFAKPEECLDIAQYSLRKGRGRIVITTTPERKMIKKIKELINEPNNIVTYGTSWNNILNLEGSLKHKLIKAYGTIKGKIESEASLVEYDGKIFKESFFRRDKVNESLLSKIVVSLDPALSSKNGNNYNGIIVCGNNGDLGYVLGDYSMKGTPQQVAEAVVVAYHKHRANLVVCERNAGGDWIPFAINTVDPNIKIETVTASRGKFTRAEPVGSLYELGRIYHSGIFSELEEQMVCFDPDCLNHENSPDRMDALVWGFWWLFNFNKKEFNIENIQGLNEKLLLW